MATETIMPSREDRPERLMLAFLCIKDANSVNEKVSILDRFGLPDAEIATISDCTVQSVRNARQKNLRKPKNRVQ